MSDDLDFDAFDLEAALAEHEDDLHRELDAGAERITQHLLDGMAPYSAEQERIIRNLAVSISEVHLELAQLQADYRRVAEELQGMQVPAGVTIH